MMRKLFYLAVIAGGIGLAWWATEPEVEIQLMSKYVAEGITVYEGMSMCSAIFILAGIGGLIFDRG